jgi:hypothetical protein
MSYAPESQNAFSFLLASIELSSITDSYLIHRTLAGLPLLACWVPDEGTAPICGDSHCRLHIDLLPDSSNEDGLSTTLSLAH